MRKEQRAAAAAGGFRFNGAKRRRNDYEWNYSSGNGVAAAAGGLQVLQKNGGSCVVVGSEVNVPYSRDIPLPWIRIVIPTRPAEEDDRKKKRRRDFFLFPFHSWNLCGVCLPLYWWITSTRIFCVNGVSVLWLAEKRIAAAFRGKSELISSTDNMHFLFNLNERLFDGLWNPGELKFQDKRKKKLEKYHDRPGNVFLITRLSGC